MQGKQLELLQTSHQKLWKPKGSDRTLFNAERKAIMSVLPSKNIFQE